MSNIFDQIFEEQIPFYEPVKPADEYAACTRCGNSEEIDELAFDNDGYPYCSILCLNASQSLEVSHYENKTHE